MNNQHPSDSGAPTRCRICNADAGHTHFRVREMFFGTREQFNYFECGHCGTIQIRDVPSDLGRHYPDNYYSFAAARTKRASRIEIALRRRRSDAWLNNGGGRIGHFLARLTRRREPYFDWLTGISLSTDSRIVDVGCGSGERLLKMQRDGFRRLCGLDPFIDKAIEYPSGVTIHKRSLAYDSGTYDLIMLHHSFEHMPDPLATMADIARRLAPEGRALVRLPIAGSYAWRTYRENWAPLDAPRHLVIPSMRAMHILAATVNLEVERFFYELEYKLYFASEAYCRDISQIEYDRSLALHALGRDEMVRFRALAEELNRNDDGDIGGFILRRKRASFQP